MSDLTFEADIGHWGYDVYAGDKFIGRVRKYNWRWYSYTGRMMFGPLTTPLTGPHKTRREAGAALEEYQNRRSTVSP